MTAPARRPKTLATRLHSQRNDRNIERLVNEAREDTECPWRGAAMAQLMNKLAERIES
jgi:hypothetical protein